MIGTPPKPLPVPSKEIARVSDINTVFDKPETPVLKKPEDTSVSPKKELGQLSPVKPVLTIPPKEKEGVDKIAPAVAKPDKETKKTVSPYSRDVSIKNIKEVRAEQEQAAFDNSVLGYLKSIDSNLKLLLNIVGKSSGGVGVGGTQPGEGEGDSGGGWGDTLLGSLLGGGLVGGWKLLKWGAKGLWRGAKGLARGGLNLGKKIFGIKTAADLAEDAAKLSPVGKAVGEAAKLANAGKVVGEGSLLSRMISPIKNFFSPPPATSRVISGAEVAAQGLERSRAILNASSKVLPEASAASKLIPEVSTAAKILPEASAIGAIAKAGKVIPVVGQALQVAQAVYDAADDESIKKMSGKEDISVTDRISNVAGGVVGGFGSLVDLGLSAVGVEGTDIGGFVKETTGKLAVDTFDSIKQGLTDTLFNLFGPNVEDITKPVPPKSAIPDVKSAQKQTVAPEESLLDKVLPFAKFSGLTLLPSLLGGVTKSITNTVETTLGKPGTKPEDASTTMSILKKLGVGGGIGALASTFMGTTPLEGLKNIASLGKDIFGPAVDTFKSEFGKYMDMSSVDKIFTQFMPNGISDIIPDLSKLDLPSSFPLQELLSGKLEPTTANISNPNPPKPEWIVGPEGKLIPSTSVDALGNIVPATTLDKNGKLVPTTGTPFLPPKLDVPSIPGLNLPELSTTEPIDFYKLTSNQTPLLDIMNEAAQSREASSAAMSLPIVNVAPPMVNVASAPTPPSIINPFPKDYGSMGSSLRGFNKSFA